MPKVLDNIITAAVPDPADAGTDVYFDNATDIPLKYGEVRVQNANASAKLAESSATTHYK